MNSYAIHSGRVFYDRSESDAMLCQRLENVKALDPAFSGLRRGVHVLNGIRKLCQGSMVDFEDSTSDMDESTHELLCAIEASIEAAGEEVEAAAELIEKFDLDQVNQGDIISLGTWNGKGRALVDAIKACLPLGAPGLRETMVIPRIINAALTYVLDQPDPGAVIAEMVCRSESEADSKKGNTAEQGRVRNYWPWTHAPKPPATDAPAEKARSHKRRPTACRRPNARWRWR